MCGRTRSRRGGPRPYCPSPFRPGAMKRPNDYMWVQFELEAKTIGNRTTIPYLDQLVLWAHQVPEGIEARRGGGQCPFMAQIEPQVRVRRCKTKNRANHSQVTGTSRGIAYNGKAHLEVTSWLVTGRRRSAFLHCSPFPSNNGIDRVCSL